uniref:Uncharacterized protein n=1 Tax=Cannabis sativa TaxID=3483 RepID=A0A803PB48_CANSA
MQEVFDYLIQYFLNLHSAYFPNAKLLDLELLHTQLDKILTLRPALTVPCSGNFFPGFPICHFESPSEDMLLRVMGLSGISPRIFMGVLDLNEEFHLEVVDIVENPSAAPTEEVALAEAPAQVLRLETALETIPVAAPSGVVVKSKGKGKVKTPPPVPMFNDSIWEIDKKLTTLNHMACWSFMPPKLECATFRGYCGIDFLLQESMLL